MVSLRALPALALLAPTILAGCLAADADGPATPAADPTGPAAGGAPLPPGEEYTGVQPIDLIFGGSLRHADTRVLLIPPGHGDLGSPTNDSRDAVDYLMAALEGILSWEPAIDLFIADFPQYAYLDDVTVQVEIYEGEVPETAGYDIIMGFIETAGPVFRGVAIQGQPDTQRTIDALGLGDTVHYSNRYILLSLFASAPRAGQDIPDYPETHEVKGVTMHEFAHTWGVGHTTTWTVEHNADLMNSPYPYVYGDGDPLGDGGERSPVECISSLDLYGLAHVYRWLPSGAWQSSGGQVSLPATIPYKLYCVEDEAQARAAAVLHGR